LIGIDKVRKTYNGVSNKSPCRIFDNEGPTFPVDYPYEEIVALVKASTPAHAKWAMAHLMATHFPIKAGDTVAKLHNTGMLTTRKVQDIVFTGREDIGTVRATGSQPIPLKDLLETTQQMETIGGLLIREKWFLLTPLLRDRYAQYAKEESHNGNTRV